MTGTSPVVSLLAVVAAMVAAGLLVGGPRRLDTRNSGPSNLRRWWATIVRGRTDGIAPRVRGGAAALAGAGGVFLLWGSNLWAVAIPAGVLIGAVAWLVLGHIESSAQHRRRVHIALDLPLVCELLAAQLQAGLPLRQAVAEVAEVMDGPMADDLAGIVHAVASGIHEPAAWRDLSRRSEWRRVAVDLARAAESGAALSDTLALHAKATTEAAEAIQEQRARSAGVRSVLPLMVCFLPAFFVIGVVPIVASLVLKLVE